MSGIEGVGGRVHLRAEDDETTRAIVERDTKVAVAGNDRTWAHLKEEHQAHVGAADAAHGAHAAYEGVEIAHGGAALGAAFGAVGGLWLGVYEFKEMHEKRDAQQAALVKDNAHVALLGGLDLPGCYKKERFEKDFRHVSRDTNTDAFRMTEKLCADTKGRALLQLHADRGMHAAKDLMLSKTNVESFLKTNPKVAESYQKDAAFREGFDAYLFTKAKGSREEVNAMEAGLEERDGWYRADHVAIRV